MDDLESGISSLCDLVNELRDQVTRITAERDAALADAERYRRMFVPQWFYADGYSSDDCRDSPNEVLEDMDLKPGKHVVKVDCAGPMPSIWLAVHTLTTEEMNARQSDDDAVVTEHASADEARAALASWQERG